MCVCVYYTTTYVYVVHVGGDTITREGCVCLYDKYQITNKIIMLYENKFGLQKSAQQEIVYRCVCMWLVMCVYVLLMWECWCLNGIHVVTINEEKQPLIEVEYFVINKSVRDLVKYLEWILYVYGYIQGIEHKWYGIRSGVERTPELPTRSQTY